MEIALLDDLRIVPCEVVGRALRTNKRFFHIGTWVHKGPLELYAELARSRFVPVALLKHSGQTSPSGTATT